MCPIDPIHSGLKPKDPPWTVVGTLVTRRKRQHMAQAPFAARVPPCIAVQQKQREQMERTDAAVHRRAVVFDASLASWTRPWNSPSLVNLIDKWQDGVEAEIVATNSFDEAKTRCRLEVHTPPNHPPHYRLLRLHPLALLKTIGVGRTDRTNSCGRGRSGIQR